MSETFLNNLEWRFAAKKFDPRKKVKSDDLKKILKAIRFSPSSLGLQAYHIFIITDQELKTKIRPLAKNQEQINDCSHLLVFCGRSDLQKHIESYLKINQKTNNLTAEKINSRRASLQKFTADKNPEELKLWASRQVYLALGFALAACAELCVDSCPMEGFNRKELDSLMQLPQYLQSVALLPLGYRASEPEFKKIRLTESDLFTWL